MRVEMYPVTDIGSLCDAINQRFDMKLEDYDLCQILFGEDYSNDCYKHFHFTANYEEYEGFSWQNANDIDIRNKTKQYLRERLPHDNRILIDVSW